MAKRVLVLGGGPGGVVAASSIASKLKREEAEVVLVDRNSYHLFPPSLLWVMIGHREPEDITRPLSLLERKGVKVVIGEVREIRPRDNSVVVNDKRLDYDYLVVSLGSIPNPAAMKGHGYVCSPWTLEGAVECRRRLAGFKGGKIIVAAYSWPYKCPPAPFEAAFLVKYLMDQRKVSGEVNVVHFWKEPMEPFGPFMVSMFKRFMDAYGIGFNGGVEVEEFREGKLITKAGDEIEYDLAIVVPPHEPPKPVAESPLASKDIGGYMVVDKKTLRHPEYPNVFGVGDVIAPSLGIGMAGVFAHFQAEYVASQIVDEIKGAYSGHHYNMSWVCVMDLGYVGAAVYCDFSGKIMGTKEYPDCVVLGGMRALRALKYAFESMWFSMWFGR